jgi:hypothetical protein
VSGWTKLWGMRSLGILASLVGAFGVAGTVASSSAYASGATFIATGHDMDFHCGFGDTEECEYLKIVVNQVRAGSTKPILALDEGGTSSSTSEIAEVPTALVDAGFTGEGEVTTVNPANATEFNAVEFVDKEGHPNYSAIITASDEGCGGCDNNEAGENNINARAKDFETFFDAGGGILALAGATRFETYYNFVPLKIGATFVSPPFTVTPFGASLGITEAMANCCATHNSFTIPAEPFQVLETDTIGNAETIGAFGTTITEGGFGKPTALSTALSGGGQSGATVTVPEGTPVSDAASLSGAGASTATGTLTYTVYSDSACTAAVVSAGTAPVSGGVAGPSEAKVLPAGTYFWQAAYSGDSQNRPSKNACGSLIETVLPAKKEVEHEKEEKHPLPPPVLGKSANVEVVSGVVFVKLPKGASSSSVRGSGSAFAALSKGLPGFIPLTEARQVPMGSTLDTRAGVARLTTATSSAGKLQVGNFGAGLFTLLQNRKQKGLVTLKLVNSTSHKVCTSLGKKAQVAKLSSKVLGRLKSNAHGKYTAVGEHASATVRGTVWTVTNQCNGTLTQVSRGVVSVRDFARRKTITVTAGHQYFARAK